MEICKKDVEGYNVIFEIGRDEVLYGIVVTSPVSSKNFKIKELSIPSEINGYKINTIAETIFFTHRTNRYDGSIRNGTIENLIISDDITTIKRNAFYSVQSVKIKKCKWSSNCYVIPNSCFEDSKLTEITNISHVTNIYMGAFAYTKLKSFNWPKKCKIIPGNCFVDTPLETISGIENVKEIQYEAFEKTKLKEFYWPSKCKEIPNSCFFKSTLENIFNIDNVKDIKDKAFKSTKLKEITWPKNCKTIPKECFFGNTYLKSVNNLENVSCVKENAFTKCPSLQEIRFGPRLDDIAPTAFMGNYYGLTVSLEQTSITESVLENCIFGEGVQVNFPYYI